RRDFALAPLTGALYICRVVPGLFHTQGGLMVDDDGRVLRPNGTPIANLFAGGGAAAGVSGHSGAGGYASGNGLLCALGLGRLAGIAAAKEIKDVIARHECRSNPGAARDALDCFAPLAMTATGGSMPFDLIIRGGTVVLPQTDGVAADIAVSGEKIAAVLSPGTAVYAAETLDAAGKLVLPGVIDVHLHLGHGKDIAPPRV